MKVNNEVRELITPIIEGMTRIYETNKHAKPLVSNQYDNPNVEMCKRDCVHVIIDKTSGRFVLAAKKEDGKVICQACGKEISTEFGDGAQKKLDEAEKVINQIIVFGMLNGLQASCIKTLISIKHVMPDVKNLASSLGKFMLNSSASSESLGDIGSEYVDTTGNGITSMR